MKKISLAVIALLASVGSILAQERPRYAEKGSLELLGDASLSFYANRYDDRSVTLSLYPYLNYFVAQHVFLLGGVGINSTLAKYAYSSDSSIENYNTFIPRAGLGYSFALREGLFLNLPLIFAHAMSVSTYGRGEYYFSNNNLYISIEPQLKYLVADRVFFNITGAVSTYSTLCPEVRWQSVTGRIFLGMSYFWP